MSQQFTVKLALIPYAKDQLIRLREESPKVFSALYNNFLRPLERQNKAEHLEGKYKPSWKLPPGNTNSFKVAYAEQCKRHNLYHYHFGFPYYQAGRDVDFPGRESDGIVHTAFTSSATQESHVLLQVDEKHPSPFRAPVHLIWQIPTTG